MDVLDPTARSLLAEGRQLHVGVLTTTGPHVTPELYTFDDTSIWFLTAADTLKARVVRRDPRVAAVVRVGSRSLLLRGTVTDYDIGDPVRLLTQARDALGALAALMSFTVRNATDLAAFARDLATGRLPSRLPPRRVLLRLVPDEAQVLEDPALGGDVDCIVAAETPDGVAVLPGRAANDLRSAIVAAGTVHLTGVPIGEDVRGALVVDDYQAPGPAAKRGELIRGRMRFELDDPRCTVSLEAERETTWNGADVRTNAV